jgi:hypothetical protein
MKKWCFVQQQTEVVVLYNFSLNKWCEVLLPQLVMTFQSYTFPIPMLFLSYESNEPGVYYRIPLFHFETETKCLFQFI